MQRLLLLLLLIPLGGCLHVKVDPVKVDATVTLRVERELEDYFNAIDSASETTRVQDDQGRNMAPNSETSVEQQ